MQFFNNR